MIYPKRIICLTEETTELLYLLQEQSRIVGISVYTVRPSIAIQEKTKVSSFISGNIKKIKSLKPDLIIGFSDIQAQLAHDLIKEGLNVLVTNQRSIEEIFETMYLIGSIVGRSKETLLLIDTWKQTLDGISRKAKTRNYKPKVFFQEWDEPIITAIQWVSELIQICGGEEIHSNKADKSLAKDRIVSKDFIADKNPDLIIGSWCGKPVDFNWIQQVEEWKQTTAVRKNKLYEIDSSIILQPGPALFLEGVQKLNSILEENVS
ncbi:MAG: cobalamin-binding protein [Leptospiraceae bacterium]|nr:cobalamin-binding protein [Leptospiraceae bacterium]